MDSVHNLWKLQVDFSENNLSSEKMFFLGFSIIGK